MAPGVSLEWALPDASAPVKGRGARAGAGRAVKLGRRGSEVAPRAPWVRARLSLVLWSSAATSSSWPVVLWRLVACVAKLRWAAASLLFARPDGWALVGRGRRGAEGYSPAASRGGAKEGGRAA